MLSIHLICNVFKNSPTKGIIPKSWAILHEAYSCSYS